MELQHVQEQRLSPSHALVETMKVLQMTAYELSDYVMAAAWENPLIDMDALQAYERQDAPGPGSQTDRKAPAGPDDEKIRWQLEDAAAQDPAETLEEHLLAQLAGLSLTGAEERVCQYLVWCVDEKGYLDLDAAQLAEHFAIPDAAAEKCLSILRGLEPPGVCAADLRQCLLYQAKKASCSPLAEAVIEHALEDVAKGHYSLAARALNARLEDVYEAVEQIGRLNPVPGRGFAGRERVGYLTADICVTVKNGKAEAEVCHPFTPCLRYDPYYTQMIRTTDDESVRDYLSRKLYSADMLRRCVSLREETLAACAKAIAEIQAGYFTGETGLAPMTLEMVAERVGRDKSTVSRAVRGKYVQCRHGIVPLKSLFVQRLGAADEGAGSADRVKGLLTEFVRKEDKENPCSDQRLCELLRERGIKVSRRAVTKYREQLGIPSTYRRAKKQKT